MCEYDWATDATAGDPDVREDLAAALTRRHFGGLLIGAAGFATVGRMFQGATGAHAAPVVNAAGLTPVANAMHIHTSFSEGPGSLHAQLSEAARNNISVLWKTDHDWREVAHGAPQRISFTSLTKELIAGKPLVWQAKLSGTFAEHNGGIVTSPASPTDPNPTPGALWVRARSAGAAAAAHRYYANFNAPRQSQRTNLAGQSLHIDLYPTHADGTNSYLELLMSVSYHPASGGRPAGRYQLSYRFGQRAPGYDKQQLLGIVYRNVTPGHWQQVTVDPVSDIRALWPDLVAEDNNLFDFWLGATSQNTTLTEGYFDNLQFTRTATRPDQVLTIEHTIKAAYASLYPNIQLPRGREISFYQQHLNGYGAALIPDYSATPNVFPHDPGWTASTQITQQLHAAGALVSFNHPFGTGLNPPTDAASQAAALLRVFSDLYTNAVCGADILEVGYQQRGDMKINTTVVSADIGTHQELWDMLSRNGFYLTGNGVSDNHGGTAGSWSKEADRFITYTWAKSTSETDQLTALAAGRVYVGELASFSGLLDLLIDDTVPMGAVSIKPSVTTRQLRIIATGLPTGSVVQLLQAPVDYPGIATVSSAKHILQTLPASAFTTGSTTTTIDTHRSSFIRLNVLNSTGRTIAFSNPIWLLSETSRRPIPTARLAPNGA
jgi:hypothetical protein